MSEQLINSAHSGLLLRKKNRTLAQKLDDIIHEVQLLKQEIERTAKTRSRTSGGK